MRINFHVFFLIFMVFYACKNYIAENVLQNISQASIHVVCNFRGLKLGAFRISSERSIVVSRRSQIVVHRIAIHFVCRLKRSCLYIEQRNYLSGPLV